jgi:hypothetical protein
MPERQWCFRGPDIGAKLAERGSANKPALPFVFFMIAMKYSGQLLEM